MRIKKINIKTPIELLENKNQLITYDWRSFSTNCVINLIDELEKIVSKYILNGENKDLLNIVIGCDSQRRGDMINYVTTIILYKMGGGRGGNVFYLREYFEIPNFFQMLDNKSKFDRAKVIKNIARQRLWTECVKSITVAQEIDKFLSKYNLRVKEIHSDINGNRKFLSSDLYQSIKGYVNGLNYISKCKPDAWGASWVANQKTK